MLYGRDISNNARKWMCALLSLIAFFFYLQRFYFGKIVKKKCINRLSFSILLIHRVLCFTSQIIQIFSPWFFFHFSCNSIKFYRIHSNAIKDKYGFMLDVVCANIWWKDLDLTGNIQTSLFCYSHDECVHHQSDFDRQEVKSGWNIR